jgi:hypothetical protein
MVQELVSNFWSNGKDLKEEAKFQASLKLLLKEVRKILDNSNPLAKSIDRDDPHEVMAKISIEENFIDLAEILLVDSEKIKT